MSAATIASASASSGGDDAMDVEGQPPASSAKPSSSGKSAGKPKKGKGKARASTRASTRAAAAAAAAAEEAAGGGGGDGDSDVDMSGGDDTGGKKKEAPVAPQSGGSADELDMVGVLDCIPREVVYAAWPGFAAPPAETDADGADGGGAGTKGSSDPSSDTSPSTTAAAVVEELPPLLKAFSSLLRSLATTDWLSAALTMLTRWAHSRGAQTAAGQQAASRWGATLVSGSGRKVLERLMRLHRYVLMEVKKARTVSSGVFFYFVRGSRGRSRGEWTESPGAERGFVVCEGRYVSPLLFARIRRNVSTRSGTKLFPPPLLPLANPQLVVTTAIAVGVPTACRSHSLPRLARFLALG